MSKPIGIVTAFALILLTVFAAASYSQTNQKPKLIKRYYKRHTKPPKKEARPFEVELAAAQEEKWWVIGTGSRGPLSDLDVSALALDGEEVWCGGKKNYGPRWICNYNVQTGRAVIWEYEKGHAIRPIDIRITPEDVWVLYESAGLSKYGGYLERFHKSTQEWTAYDAKEQGLNLGWAKSLWATDNAVWTTFMTALGAFGGVTCLDPNTGRWELLDEAHGGLPHPSGADLAGGPEGIFAVSRSMYYACICKLEDDTRRWNVFAPLAANRPSGEMVYHNGYLVWKEVDKGLCAYDLSKKTIYEFPEISKAAGRLHAFDGRCIYLAFTGKLPTRESFPLGRFDTINKYFAGFDYPHWGTGTRSTQDIEIVGDYVWFATNRHGIVRMKKTNYPSIESTIPVDGADNVAPNTEISTTFSHPMHWDQFNNQAISLWTGAIRLQATVSYDPSTRIATLRPEGALKPAATYEVRVQSGLRDIYDEPLPQEYSYTFRVASDPE
jgi:hypothetical protein